jgi:hypothetical protein
MNALHIKVYTLVIFEELTFKHSINTTNYEYMNAYIYILYIHVYCVNYC